MAWRSDMGRNKMRYQAGNPNVIEMLIQSTKYGDRITLFDAPRLQEVKDHLWHIQKGAKTFYARTTWATADGAPTTM